VGHGVAWRRCDDCGQYRIPVLSMAGPFTCIDGSHTMVAVVRCFACEHEYPKALGACVHRGCPAALQKVDPCFFCRQDSRLARASVCTNPACKKVDVRMLRCDKCNEWSLPADASLCHNADCAAVRSAAVTLKEDPTPPRRPEQRRETARLDALLLKVADRDGDDRYDLRKIVFEGGMGEIWRAFDRILDREVALKRAQKDLAENVAARAQYLKEARVGARLLHPNVLTVFDVGVDREQRVYFTMRFVDGASLRVTIDSLATACATNFVEFPLRKVVGAFLKACHGVAFAHEKGVLHLDLKPDNVLVSGFSEVFVIDWGIARVDGEDDSERLLELSGARDGERKGSTSTLFGKAHPVTGLPGAIVGTPGYMSPEQFEAQRDKIGPATDVFGLGGILFYALYGTPPCRPGEEGVMDTLELTLDPQKPGRLRPGMLPKGERVKKEHKDALGTLEAICLKALERDPAKRYSTVDDLALDVKEWLESTKNLE
jgi:serine/threonine-protein kinase